jgi:hypothetical protein
MRLGRGSSLRPDNHLERVCRTLSANYAV